MHKAIKKRAANGERRRALQNKLKEAINAGDIDLAKELQSQLDAVAPKSNGRPSSSKHRDPHDPELVELYADRTALSILGEYAKEIRMDFGYLGVVPGLDSIVVEAASSAGAPVTTELRRELCRRLFVKLSERTHGQGALYVERANQVIRKLYEHPEVVRALGLPVDGDRPWLGRRDRGDYGAEFAEKWEAHVREIEAQVDAEPDADDQPEPEPEPGFDPLTAELE